VGGRRGTGPARYFPTGRTRAALRAGLTSGLPRGALQHHRRHGSLRAFTTLTTFDDITRARALPQRDRT
jgi:hypothetical protein